MRSRAYVHALVRFSDDNVSWVCLMCEWIPIGCRCYYIMLASSKQASVVGAPNVTSPQQNPITMASGRDVTGDTPISSSAPALASC